MRQGKLLQEHNRLTTIKTRKDMRVDFTNIELKPTLKGNPVRDNLTEVIAEQVYQHACTLAAHKLALKIDACKGVMDLDDNEIKIILGSIRSLKYYAQIAIKHALGDEKEL